MSVKHERPDLSACPPWQDLLRHVVQAERLTHQERDFVVDHIGRCPRCYDIYAALSDAEMELWDEAAKAAGTSTEEICFTRPPKHALADLQQRIARDTSAPRRKCRPAVMLRVGRMVAAACILIVLGGWMAMHPGDSRRSDSGLVAHNGGSRAFAEWVTSEGHQPLALGQPVVSNSPSQEVLLGGMHRVVMKRDTKVTFAAAVPRGHGDDSGNVLYEIRLARGELYVEVVPGNPFTVRTSNARLDITGTKFDVVADGDKTEVTLLEGSIKFSQPLRVNADGASVNVTAGHASTIVGRSAPSTPHPAEAFALMAWARDWAVTNAVARIHPEDDVLLGSLRNYWPWPQPLDLASLYYKQWRDDQRAWFAREFPWIFKAQKALKDQYGIDVDYMELLIISHDIWQFNYPRAIDQRIPILHAASVAQIAAHYGVNPIALLQSAGVNTLTITEKSTDQGTGQPSEADTLAESARKYRSALQRWHSAVTGLNKVAEGSTGGVLLFTLRAGVFLTNTRTAAWLWTQSHPDQASTLFREWQKQDVTSFGLGPSTTFESWQHRLSSDASAANDIWPMTLKLLMGQGDNEYCAKGDSRKTRLAGTIAAIAAPDGSP